MSDSSLVGISKFLRLISKLKRVQRQGWLDRGVEDPESVADHSFAVALLAWLLAAGRDDLDRDRVLLLGLVHDLPEAVAGDTTPFDRHRDESGKIDPALFMDAPVYPADARDDKQQREASALDEMLSTLPDDLAAAIRTAWHEYDLTCTPEARFVKQVDKLETVLQALVYREIDPALVIDSFLRGAERDISDPDLVQVFNELRGER